MNIDLVTKGPYRVGETYQYHSESEWRTSIITFQGECMAVALGATIDESRAKAQQLAASWEMREALEAAEKHGCGCYSNETRDWHSTDCCIPQIRAALALN